MTQQSLTKIKKELNTKYGRSFISLRELCTELDENHTLVNMRRPREIYDVGHQVEQRWLFEIKDIAPLVASGFTVAIIKKTEQTNSKINIKRRERVNV